MEFIIKQAISKEAYFGNKISFNMVDLVDLEKFINNHISPNDYGASIDKFYYGFELFDFHGNFSDILFKAKDYKSYRWKSKALVINDQFDYVKFKDLPISEQLDRVTKSILRSISKTNELKRKPKDFRYRDFRTDMEIILGKYRRV